MVIESFLPFSQLFFPSHLRTTCILVSSILFFDMSFDDPVTTRRMPLFFFFFFGAFFVSLLEKSMREETKVKMNIFLVDLCFFPYSY